MDREVMLALAAERRRWLTWGMKLLSVTGSGLVEFPFAILLMAGPFAPKTEGAGALGRC